MRNLIKILLCFSMTCCNSYSSNQSLRSDDKDAIIQEFVTAGNAKDSSFVRKAFVNIYDPRITHNISHYGMSVYQSKVFALKEISGLKPPKAISCYPDTAIVDFYLAWAIKSGYFK